MLKIYIAGKWKEREKVRSLMDMFEARGHFITCDWTKHIAPERLTQEHEKGCFTKEYDWSKNVDWAQNGHKTYAEEDLEGVKTCDIIVAYMPDPDIFYKGAWIEIGIALGLNKMVVIIGKDITTVFLGLPNIVVVQYKEEAISYIDTIQFDKDYKEGAKENPNYDTDCFIAELK